MIGAILGDVINSAREFKERHDVPETGNNFSLVPEGNSFTDDTILTVSIMDWALHAEDRDTASITKYFQRWAKRYPDVNFGNSNSIRVSPLAYIAKSKEDLLELLDLVTGVTYNRTESIKDTRSIALATYMALHGASKEEIKEMAISAYPEIATFNHDELVKNHHFNKPTQTSYSQALYCFLESTNFEDCVKKSTCISEDTNGLLAMSCVIAEAFYKDIPQKLIDKVWCRLDNHIQKIVIEFYNTFEKENEGLSVFELYNDLDRFLKAQEDTYEQAETELQNGKKMSHWMWYIFPQIRGLRMTSKSYKYGLSGINETKQYFKHDILGQRLVELCNILLMLESNDATMIFGYLDDMKLKASMTVFYIATNEKIFMDVLNKFFGGKLDENTMTLLNEQRNNANDE